MSDNGGYGQLSNDADTLSPLPGYHRSGLIAVTVCAAASLICCSTLLVYLLTKLTQWLLRHPRRVSDDRANSVMNDLSLGLPQKQLGPAFQDRRTPVEMPEQPQPPPPPKRKLNQFLVLFINLLIADLHQSLAFLLNGVWLGYDGILVNTSTCWAQGWFVSTGDLASSCFVTAIAAHAYFTVVRGYKPSQWLLWVIICCVWIFIYLMAALGPGVTENGRSVGGFYVRAAGWCWINSYYSDLRLWLHYFWIFCSLALTSLLYILIFLHVQRKGTAALPITHSRSADLKESHHKGTHPVFLLYPLIYVVCTLPLAAGRIASMAGSSVPIPYFLLAGAMITSNGWLDVVLFSSTRGSVIFGASPDSEDTGLETFTFMRTPHTRVFGNMVWVQGGTDGDENGSTTLRSRRAKNGNGWEIIGKRMGWGWGSGGAGKGRASESSEVWDQSSTSQISLRRGGGGGGGNSSGGENAIHMDTVTTVIVEMHDDPNYSKDDEIRSAPSTRGSLEKKISEDIFPQNL